MHELSQLGKLERKYSGELVVLGVHSAKYPAEGDPHNLKHAVQRYAIRHPVVNDPEYRVWDAYAVNAWPTLVFVSPDGQVLGRQAGEATFEALDQLMAQLILEYEADGRLSRDDLDLGNEPFAQPPDQLSFPGKVLATAQGLFIADSGHHRIISTDLDGTARATFGSGKPGLRDGHSSVAQFFRPQGMALDAEGRILYVADSENHAIRAVDVETQQVGTVAGTGEQAHRTLRTGPALGTPLSSPWDLALDGHTLYIAMAGLHQVWSLDLKAGAVAVHAGTGHEALRDGSRETAWLAQPMGLALHHSQLYVSCAETQAVRQIDLEAGTVSTLVGAGLFDFGDEDGPAAEARLQHNQDVAVIDGFVYIVDTYNNKVKVLDLASSRVSAYLGSGQAGLLDGPGENARFDEPAGVSLYGGSLFIADTNNHCVRVADLDTGHVRTLDVGVAAATPR